jgi:hypothetical protein
VKITGLMPVRNEDWILGFALRADLMWMDEMVLLLHSCTDHSREIAEQVQAEVGKDRLEILENPDPVWRDMNQRQFLLEAGRHRDTEYFCILDADEVLTGDLLPRIRQMIFDLEPGQCLAAPWISIWKSIFHYRLNSTVMSHSTIAFRDAPLLHWRSDKGYDQHHRNPYEAIYIPDPDFKGGGAMHFQFTDWRRIVAKHALYKMSEAWRWPGRKTVQEINRQYDATLNETGVELAPTPFEWFAPYTQILSKLHLNETPWHEAECRRLREIHGPRVFQGLNLYGLLPTGEPAQPASQARPLQDTDSGSKARTMQQPAPVGQKMTLTEINRAKRLGLQKGVNV